MSAARLALRNRLLSAALVLGVLAFHRIVFADPAARASALYACVVAIGYGHLLGGALFGGPRLRARLPPALRDGLGAAFLASALLLALALHLALAAAWPGAIVPWLALSVWHAFENDLALSRLYREQGRVAPMPRRASHHLPAAGLSALAVAVFLASLPQGGLPLLALAGPTPAPDVAALAARGIALACGGALLLRRAGSHRRLGAALVTAAALLPRDISPVLGFAEVFAAWTLYHVFQWAILSIERVRLLRRSDPAAARRSGRRLAAVHLAPAALCAALVALPLGWEHPARVVVFAPAIYLFWATLHVVQTLWVRGLEVGRHA